MKFFLKLILLIIFLGNFKENLTQELTGSSLDLFDYQDTPITFSVLIATIEKRKMLFERLYQKLIAQLKTYNLEHQVEVLFYQDNQTVTVGCKRNWLVQNAKGEYVCFLDDDDNVCDTYLKLIYDACQFGADCISCTGIFYMPNQKPKVFRHSLKYHRIFNDSNGASCSPVYHINPVKRILALMVPFPEQNRQEDDVWSQQMQQRNILKTEVVINTPYYFYHYNPHKQV